MKRKATSTLTFGLSFPLLVLVERAKQVYFLYLLEIYVRLDKPQADMETRAAQNRQIWKELEEGHVSVDDKLLDNSRKGIEI